MNLLTLLLIIALVGVVGSLAMGITAMACDGQVRHRSSAQWMTMRVAFQGFALVLLLLTMVN